jgi:hypothetical protein
MRAAHVAHLSERRIPPGGTARPGSLHMNCDCSLTASDIEPQLQYLRHNLFRAEDSPRIDTEHLSDQDQRITSEAKGRASCSLLDRLRHNRSCHRNIHNHDEKLPAPECHSSEQMIEFCSFREQRIVQKPADAFQLRKDEQQVSDIEMCLNCREYWHVILQMSHIPLRIRQIQTLHFKLEEK